MKKKLSLLAIILVVAMCFSCSSPSSESGNTEPENPETILVDPSLTDPIIQNVEYVSGGIVEDFEVKGSIYHATSFYVWESKIEFKVTPMVVKLSCVDGTSKNAILNNLNYVLCEKVDIDERWQDWTIKTLKANDLIKDGGMGYPNDPSQQNYVNLEGCQISFKIKISVPDWSEITKESEVKTTTISYK